MVREYKYKQTVSEDTIVQLAKVIKRISRSFVANSLGLIGIPTGSFPPSYSREKVQGLNANYKN